MYGGIGDMNLTAVTLDGVLWGREWQGTLVGRDRGRVCSDWEGTEWRP
jgi:hypothetical protein